MPTRPTKQRDLTQPIEMVYTDFSGGLDAKSKKNGIIQNGAWFCENCSPKRKINDVNTYGALCTRPGYTNLLDPPAGVASLTNLCWVSTTVGAVSQWVFALDPATGSVYRSAWSPPLAWVGPVITIAGATEMRAINASGYGIFCLYGAGVGGMYSWSGAAWAAIAATPVARYIAYHRNRVFVGGADLAPWRVHFSDLRSPLAGYGTSAAPVNWFDDIDDDTGYQITGMIELGDRLIVATGLRFYALAGSGPPDYGLYKISERVGCSAPGSLTTNGEMIFFLSNEGFMAWDTSSKPIDIGVAIWNYYRNDFDASLATTMKAAWHDKALYIIYRTATGTNKYRGLICDMTGEGARGWFPTRVDSWNFSSLLAVDNGLYLLALDGVNGKLVQMDSSQSDGANGIDTEWRHAHWDGGLPTIPKRLKCIEIEAEVDTAGTDRVAVDIYRDLSTTAETLITDSAVDMSLIGVSTNAGAHLSAGRGTYTRSIVVFRMRTTQGQDLFHTLSWAVKRTGAKTGMVILAVRVSAMPEPSEN